MHSKAILLILVLTATATANATDGDADGRGEARIGVEAGAVWQSRNDVRIPGDTGTRFAADGITGSGPFGFVRLEIAGEFAPRHGLRLVYAPLRISESGTAATPLAFAGERFDSGELAATYQFNAHRLSYRYQLRQQQRWQLQLGVTLLVRDAVVRLRQGDLRAEDTDVGLVPLLHVAGSYRLSDRWNLAFDLDGLAAPQGRAFDLGLRAEYAIADRWAVSVGYRTLDGGVDSDDVYNFAWFNYALIGMSYRLR
ncbi:MAG: hypothetical protein ACNA7W_19495 [Pseudomonadales bacterium]